MKYFPVLLFSEITSLRSLKPHRVTLRGDKLWLLSPGTRAVLVLWVSLFLSLCVFAPRVLLCLFTPLMMAKRWLALTHLSTVAGHGVAGLSHRRQPALVPEGIPVRGWRGPCCPSLSQERGVDSGTPWGGDAAASLHLAARPARLVFRGQSALKCSAMSLQSGVASSQSHVSQGVSLGG